MGIDCLCITLRLEKRFGVQLRTFGFSEVRTVADVAAVVIHALRRTHGKCTSLRTFRELRDLLQREGDIDPRRIRTHTPLAELFPMHRRALWRRIAAREPRLPDLVLSESVGAIASLSLGLSWWFGVMVTAVFAVKHQSYLAPIVGAAALIGWTWVFRRVRDTFLCRFPRDMQTVGDLVRGWTRLAMAQHGSGARLIQELHVLEEVRRIIAQELNLPLEEVRPESNLFAELNVS